MIHFVADEQREQEYENLYESRKKAISYSDHLQTPDELHVIFGATCLAAATPAMAPAAFAVVWAACELAARAAVSFPRAWNEAMSALACGVPVNASLNAMFDKTGQNGENALKS